VVFINDQGANAIDLTAAATGLLRSADDGKGTVLRFGYARAKPSPGVIRRHAVLSDLTVESSGYDAVTYHYDYGTPVVHSQGKYLIGFDSVDKHSPFLTEHIEFQSLTDAAGIATEVAALDPISEALLALETARPGAGVTASFAYDDRERFHASWDDISGGSQAQPLVSYLYQDATQTTPGRIDTETLADAASGTTRHAIALLAADGEPMVSGISLGDHFSLGETSIATRSTRTQHGAFLGVTPPQPSER
jgi:hypothetical protein